MVLKFMISKWKKKKKKFSAAQWDTCSPFGFALHFCFFGSSSHMGKHTFAVRGNFFFFFLYPAYIMQRQIMSLWNIQPQ